MPDTRKQSRRDTLWVRIERIRVMEAVVMRQPGWDKYETALLIEAYRKIKADRSKKGSIVAALSSSLRKRASFEIDDTFRNENGINMRLGELPDVQYQW